MKQDGIKASYPAFIPYNRNLRDTARTNRKNPTPAEKKMWQLLRSGLLTQYKFLRQKPLDHFIVDFYCSELALIIEVDGESHAHQMKYDQERTLILESKGLSTLRFTNHDVLYNPEGIYQCLVQAIEAKK